MHRDIKPGNLYLTEDGLILLDFGSARQVTGTHTSSMLIFSAGFSPYEQYIEGQLNRQGSWTDVYALAATLYVMVTGHRLPSGLDRIQAQLRNQPDLLKPAQLFVPEVPTALDAVLSRALAVEPDARTPSVGILKRELQVVLAEVEPPPVVPPLSAKTEGAATTVLQQLPPKLSPMPKSTADPLIRPQPEPTPKSSTVVKKPLMRLNLGALAISMLLVFAGLAAVFVGGNYWWQWRETVAQETKAAADKAAADKAAADKAAAGAKRQPEAQQWAGSIVRIVGGCFQMGSPATEAARSSDERQHRVCVKDFEIGSYEVTQAQWQAVMGNNPSHFENCAHCPVEQVSWNDVQDYLARLNQKTGNTYRLPTEAEWEYACRGGVAGERYCGGNDVGRLAWRQ